MPGDGGGGGHRRADQMRAPTLALAAFKVTVRGARATFTWLQDVRIHAEAHAAAGLTPLETCRGEDAVQALLLGGDLRLVRAGNDHGSHARVHFFALDDVSCRAQILDPRVGARADKDAIQ